MAAATSAPVILKPSGPASFPDPKGYDAEGLLAIGGDLSTPRLIAAYRSGIFPWYNEGMPPLWWCPDPRAVITLKSLHIPRSLQRLIKQQRFSLSWNKAFLAVVEGCGTGRRGGTWILPEMREAYLELHKAGHAHSLEVWQHDELVGGLYGVQCGALFAAESMFHSATDASKIALVQMVSLLSEQGVELFDVQFLTPHLERCGAHTLSRAAYLAEVARLRDIQLDLSSLRL